MATLRLLVLASALVMMGATACGGDDDSDLDEGSPANSPAAEQPGGGDNNGEQDQPDGGAGESGGGSARDTTPMSAGGNQGDVAVSASAGEAIVDADGQTLVYTANDSINYTCEIGAERATVNFQTPDGHDLLVQAGILDGEWSANITFSPRDENVRYSITAPDDGDLRVGESALTFEGTAEFSEIGNDLDSRRDVDVSIEVNCASPGGGEDASAEIDGETYVFPVSGAQSYECEVSDDQFRIVINRLGLDDIQLSLEARQDEAVGGWLGNVSVVVEEVTYISTLPVDGEGLTVDGTSIAYTGMFEQRMRSGDVSDEEVEGSVAVSCS